MFYSFRCISVRLLLLNLFLSMFILLDGLRRKFNFIFIFVLLVYKNTVNFFVLIYSAILLNSFNCVCVCVVYVYRNFLYKRSCDVIMDIILLFQSGCFSFSFLIAFSRTSTTMFSKVSRENILVLLLISGGKHSVFYLQVWY